MAPSCISRSFCISTLHGQRGVSLHSGNIKDMCLCVNKRKGYPQSGVAVLLSLQQRRLVILACVTWLRMGWGYQRAGQETTSPAIVMIQHLRVLPSRKNTDNRLYCRDCICCPVGAVCLPQQCKSVFLPARGSIVSGCGLPSPTPFLHIFDIAVAGVTWGQHLLLAQKSPTANLSTPLAQQGRL